MFAHQTLFGVVRQCFCFFCADMPHFSENTFVHTCLKEGRLSPSVSVKLLGAQQSCVRTDLALHKYCPSIAEHELCSQQGGCRKGGALSFIEGSACPHVFPHGCLLWNLYGPQITDTAELRGSQVACTSAFCAAPWWGVKEMLTEEVGCFS